MRVLYVENAIGFGGSLTGLLELIKHLPAEVEPILACNFEVKDYVSLPENIPYENVDIKPMPPHPGGALRGLWRLYRYDVAPWGKALAGLIKKHRVDLIHGNNACMVNVACGLAGRRAGVPTISHQKGFENDGRIERAILKYKLFTRHIATSPAMARRLFDLGLDPSRSVSMWEPITPPDVPRRRARTPDDSHEPVVITMCSMLTPWKGQDVFLKAIGRLKKMTSTPIKVILAGSSPTGEDGYPSTLRSLTKELGIESIVEFAGRVRDVYGLLARSDIAAHSSVEPEPFGRVVAEAMICGLPVIASSDGGPADYIQQGKTGVIFKRRDDLAMAEALLPLIESEELRQTMGRAAAEYALNEFDPTRLGREMADYYRLVIDEYRAGKK